ncbi:unnamed protein product, partial [Ectocarpus sp. 12 AP-2014]
SPSSERFAVVHASSVISKKPAYKDTAPISLSCMLTDMLLPFSLSAKTPTRAR